MMMTMILGLEIENPANNEQWQAWKFALNLLYNLMLLIKLIIRCRLWNEQILNDQLWTRT